MYKNELMAIKYLNKTQILLEVVVAFFCNKNIKNLFTVFYNAAIKSGIRIIIIVNFVFI